MTALREAVARAIEEAPTLSFSYDQESGTFCAMALTPEGEHVTIGSYLTQALAITAARKWMCVALADAALSAVARHIAERVEAARVEEREKVAAFMGDHSLATGHGDTIEDLLGEAGWQIEKLRATLAVAKEEAGRLKAIIDEAADHPGEAYLNGLDCGVEDRDINDRYEAARYGWEQCLEYVRSVLANADAALEPKP